MGKIKALLLVKDVLLPEVDTTSLVKWTQDCPIVKERAKLENANTVLHENAESDSEAWAGGYMTHKMHRAEQSICGHLIFPSVPCRQNSAYSMHVCYPK